MRLKLLAIHAGPRGVFHPGAEITVGEQEGQQLLEGGYAELVPDVEVEAAGDDEPESESAEEAAGDEKKPRRRR